MACVAITSLVACGGDDEGDNNTTGGTGGTTGGTGGDSGTSGGDGGTTGGTGGTTGGTGGATGGMGGMPAFTCTDDPPTTAVMCGGTACPMPMMLGGMDACARPCCVTVDGAETCGTKNTNDVMPLDCAPPPVPDERCPDFDDVLMMTREGCCTPEDTCGVISTIYGRCVTESQLVPTLPATPPSCDEAGGDDAGME